MSITIPGRSDASLEVLKYAGTLIDPGSSCEVLGFDKKIDGEHTLVVRPPVGNTRIKFKGNVILIEAEEKGTVVSGHNEPEIYFDLILRGAEVSVLKDFIMAAHNHCHPRTDFKRVICKRYASGTYWYTYARRKKKSLKTVFLPVHQLDDIVSSIDSFLKAEDEYLLYGMPYKMVLLFTGGAGLGKSTLAFALSSHFDLDLYVYSFCDQSSDSTLIRAIHDMDKDSVLLLEDIDAGLEGNKITMNAITNITDGVLTRDKMIVIMTTNYVDKLQDVLLRPGRIDKVIKFEIPTFDIVFSILKFYRKEEEDILKKVSKVLTNRNLTTASIISLLFSYRNSTENIDSIVRKDISTIKKEYTTYHS